MNLTAHRIKPLLLGMIVFDLVLGLGALLVPEVVAQLLWPTAGPDAMSLLRRTGCLWLFFAAAQVAAWQRPVSPERLRFVALLRWMDVPADITWVCSAHGLSGFGMLAIGGSPVCNLLLGVILWRTADRLDLESPAAL
jgi:hypothetical protein